VTAVVGARRELQLPCVWRAIEEAEAVLYVPERPLEALPWREELLSPKRVLVLVDLFGQGSPEEALQLGAGGYVGRRDAVAALVERLLQAVRQAAAASHPEPAGEQSVSPPVAGEAQSMAGLTARESMLLQWLVDGQTAKEIGRI
jgi:DNA-binding NarL/FixJ family response regulator